MYNNFLTVSIYMCGVTSSMAGDADIDADIDAATDTHQDSRFILP